MSWPSSPAPRGRTSAGKGRYKYLVPPLRVLIIDDEADVRDPLREWLVRAGYEAVAAAGGREAIALAKRDRFDAVVTDYVMPGLDGLAVLDQLREAQPELQVIFLTGHATKELAIAALRHGRAYDLLEKPLHNARRLADLIDTACAASRPPGDPAPPAGSLPEALQAAMARSMVVKAVFEHVAADLAAPLTLGGVAEAVGYHPAYLTDLVRNETGMPLVRWIAELRVRHAQALLTGSDLGIGEVGARIGYPDRSLFARFFRRYAGVSPAAWRASGGGEA